jgi:glycine oxidase
MKYDVGVIGGGVIGLACAWRMAQAGARVVLFERGPIGREASWAAAGMLAPQCEAAHYPPVWDSDEQGSDEQVRRAAMFALCVQSRALYADFADELLDVSGVDIELSLSTHAAGDWRQPGILYIATRDDRAVEAFEAQRGQGQRVEDTTPFAGHRAVWLPDEGQVENRKLVEALHLAAIRAGVTLHQTDPICEVRLEDDRITHLISQQHDVMCDKVLLCAGSWSNQLGGLPAECLPPVRPVAGQVLSLRGNRQISHVIYGSDVYLVPRRDGRLLVGATMEETGFHKRLTAGGLLSLLRPACELVPELTECMVEAHWAGLRPATDDGLPILGRTPLENLFVATGHFRNGILLTPVTAELMTDYILRDAETPVEFSLDRFREPVPC